MARFAVIGDIHGHTRNLRQVIEIVSQDFSIDGLLQVGDLADDHATTNGLSELDAVFELLRTPGVPVYYVPGNHDTKGLEYPTNIDGGSITVQGINILGIGGAGPMKFGFPYEWDDDDVRGLNIAEMRVILSHTPPFNTRLDKLAGGAGHGGSSAIREYAERFGGALLCGHIHEAVGAQCIRKCLCYNAGSLASPYGSAQFGILDVGASSPVCRVSHFGADGQVLWSLANEELGQSNA